MSRHPFGVFSALTDTINLLTSDEDGRRPQQERQQEQRAWRVLRNDEDCRGHRWRPPSSLEHVWRVQNVFSPTPEPARFASLCFFGRFLSRRHSIGFSFEITKNEKENRPNVSLKRSTATTATDDTLRRGTRFLGVATVFSATPTADTAGRRTLVGERELYI